MVKEAPWRVAWDCWCSSMAGVCSGPARALAQLREAAATGRVILRGLMLEESMTPDV
jgi:hypothetical protein